MLGHHKPQHRNWNCKIFCKILRISCLLEGFHREILVVKFIRKTIRQNNYIKLVPYTSGKIWSARLIFQIFLAVCLNISTAINIKILTNSNQQTQSYEFTSHIAAFLSVVLITEMLEICIQTIWTGVNTSTTLQTKPVVVWDSYTETYTSNHGKLKNRPTNP